LQSQTCVRYREQFLGSSQNIPTGLGLLPHVVKAGKALAISAVIAVLLTLTQAADPPLSETTSPLSEE